MTKQVKPVLQAKILLVEDDEDDYDCDDNEGGGATRGRKRRRTNTDDDDDGDDHHRHSTFVSHNIPLLPPAVPCGDDDYATLSDAMRRSRSLLE